LSAELPATSSPILNPASKPSLVRRGLAELSYRLASGRSSLARGFMRDQPLLLILDEPTDAWTPRPNTLFERYAAAAHGVGDSHCGRITILVSHRFSTVRIADLIVVLDCARLVEVGTHFELMAKGGQYSGLSGIQAAAYR
jgi:ATP-binding cassette subfamily B protein